MVDAELQVGFHDFGGGEDGLGDGETQRHAGVVPLGEGEGARPGVVARGHREAGWRGGDLEGDGGWHWKGGRAGSDGGDEGRGGGDQI